MNMLRSFSTAIILSLITSLISSCGGSGSEPAPATTTLTGSVVAGPVSGSVITVKNSSGVALASASTRIDGTFSVTVPASSLTAALRLEAAGGTYVDEATGATSTAGTLSTYASGGSLTTGIVNLDPSTTIICDLVTKHGKTAGEANSIFRAAFGYTPDPSIASKNTSSANASAAERLAALRAGAFSRLTMDLGLSPGKQFDLLDALASDLADGALNSTASGTIISIGTTTIPTDIANRFEHALVSYLSDTIHNLTGLNPAQIGDLPFSKVVFTNSFRVEYIPEGNASTGKTRFKIKVSDLQSNPVSTPISLMPRMHMSSMMHSTPADMVTEETGTSGTYDCSAYYLMASGSGMGYWELVVSIGSGMAGETATFYPSVGMGMSTPGLLSGPTDSYMSMGSTKYNSYYLFPDNDGMVSASTPTIDVFITHGENMRMAFKPVYSGAVLSSPTGTITSLALRASTSSDFATAVAGTHDGNGHWSFSGLAGLSSGVTATVYVDLSVNGEAKSSGTGSSAVPYATFFITPM